MTSILTPSQAEAVIAAYRTLAVVGGRVSRIVLALADGAVRIRCYQSGEICVRRIDEAGRVTALRKYSDLAYFARRHQEDDE